MHVSITKKKPVETPRLWLSMWRFLASYSSASTSSIYISSYDFTDNTETACPTMDHGFLSSISASHKQCYRYVDTEYDLILNYDSVVMIST